MSLLIATAFVSVEKRCFFLYKNDLLYFVHSKEEPLGLLILMRYNAFLN